MTSTGRCGASASLGDRHVARAGALGGGGGEDGRAGEAGRAADDDDRAAGELRRVGARGRAARRARAGPIRPACGRHGAPGGMPMSITCTSPAWALPGCTHRPGLAAWKVAVAAARTASPSTSPVEPLTPLGMSAATTGAPAPLIAAITSSSGARGAPSKPVPEQRVDDHPGAVERGQVERVLEHVHLAARLAQHARGDLPVAAVVALPAHDDDAAAGATRVDDVGEARAGALHQIVHPEVLDRPAVDLALLLGVGERLEPAGASRGDGDRARHAAAVRQRHLDAHAELRGRAGPRRRAAAPSAARR